MMMIILILTASYIWDDVRIVYALAIYDAIFFDNQPTNKAILGVRLTGPKHFLHKAKRLSNALGVSFSLVLLLQAGIIESSSNPPSTAILSLL